MSKYVVDQIRLEMGLEDLVEVLASQSGRWLSRFGRLACASADQELKLMGWSFLAPQGRGTKEVRIELGALKATPGGSLAFPISWETEGYTSVFGSFDGEILLTPVDEMVDLRVEGTYEAPPILDRDPAGKMVAHRAALAAIRSLTTNLRDALATPRGEIPREMTHPRHGS